MRIARLHSRQTARLTIALLVAALLTFAQTASASRTSEEIVLHCTHNESLSGFSQGAYREALKELEADTEEYSGCASQIRRAQLAAAAGRGGAGGGPAAGASALTPLPETPSEQRAIRHAVHDGVEPVQLGGHVIAPGVVHVDLASALSALPTPVFVTLAFLLACVLAIAGAALRKRVRTGRSD